MKKKLLLSLFILLLCAFSTLQAASDSAKLELRAQIEEVLQIVVDADSIADNMVVSLDDTIEDLLVGTVTERTNSKTGYTVTIKSDNASLLVNEDGSMAIPYTVIYGESIIDLSGGSSTVVDTNSRTTAAGTIREVRISYTTQDIRADVYEDILTFVISSK